MAESRNLLELARRRTSVLIAAPALAAALAVGGLGTAVLAQDDGSPARPAHIHEGSCGEEELGGIVAPLTELTGGEDGAAVGNAQATTAETSFTSVPLPLDAILAADHAINVHLSEDQIEVYIACGEIGGVPDANGNLVIGLRELNDSNFTGIAFLAAGADGASTDVSVFIAENLGEGAAAVDTIATPAAVGGAETATVTPATTGATTTATVTGDAVGTATPDTVGGDADETVTAEVEETATVVVGVTATVEADVDVTVEADETATAEVDETATAEADETVTADEDAAATPES